MHACIQHGLNVELDIIVPVHCSTFLCGELRLFLPARLKIFHFRYKSLSFSNVNRYFVAVEILPALFNVK